MKYIFYLSILNILSCLISTAHAIEDNIISHLANEYTTEQETKMILHLNEDINISNLDTLSFNIPLPPGLMAPGKHLKIFHKDNEIKLYSTPHIWWKEISTNEDHSIRSLAVQIPNENYSFPLELSILFNNTPSDKKYLKPIAEKKFTTKIISLDKEGSKKEIPIQSPFVYPTFQPEWLSKCLLRSFSLPINKNTKLKWFDDAFLQYSNAYLNNTLSALNKSGNISLLDSEPWMYDLAATFFNMYIKTGDIKWLRHAHVTSQIYAHHIDEDGQLNFDSKKDLKYSYNLSILIDSILIGDESLHPKMEKIASFTSKWKEDYKFGSGFWTERHQTYSLLGSLVAWEATGKKDHLNNAIKIAEATINEALNPENNWEPLGCVLHTVRSHEGDDDDRPGCSPWMSALLSEAMFRYYLQSGDNNALNFVYNLAIFITKFGTYQVTDDRHLKGQHIPWYFAGKNLEYTDNGPWDDRQHACDVSGLLARGSWAGKILNKDTAAIHSTTENLLETCKKSFSKKIKPHRKYNWWFGTTSDLTYFYQNMDI